MKARPILFVGGAIALAVLPLLLFRADEWMGFVVLVLVSPVAVLAPLATAGFVVTGREFFRATHYLGAFLLLAANLALLLSGTWGFALTSCWNCSWPFPVAKLLLLSNAVVLVGAVMQWRRRPSN